MSTCRWDREFSDYLQPDGTPCLTDDYGDPTRHCTARRGCSEHIGPHELTCARCIGRTRTDIRVITMRAPELWPVALHTGVESEAANLVGPAADVEAWSWRKVAAKQGRAWHASLMEDDDEHHPYSVLARWVMMLAEDYGLEAPVMPPDQIGIERAAAFLERLLPRLAHDVEQDFPLFAREVRKCRQHLESVLGDSMVPERGAPCPRCEPPAPRLLLERGHWCADPECTQRFHFSTTVDRHTGEVVPDTSGDRWVCPRDRSHAWVEDDYRRWVADVYEANRSA